MPEPERDWHAMAKAAMRSAEGFEALLAHMESSIVQLSRHFCRMDPEGAAQEARMHLFKIVFIQKRVDLKKSSRTIKSFLLCDVIAKCVMKVQKTQSLRGMNCKAVGGYASRAPEQPDRDYRNDRPAILPLAEEKY